MVNWREWTRGLQGEGVRGQLGRKWCSCVHRVEPNTDSTSSWSAMSSKMRKGRN